MMDTITPSGETKLFTASDNDRKVIYPPLKDDIDVYPTGGGPLSGLSPESWAIRCLELKPGKGQEEIKCTLVTQYLGEAGGKYEALSYAWGDVAKSRSITLNGHSVKITKNLESALFHLRRPISSRMLWIDALCIDQNEMSELNKYVQRMWAIYEKARYVVVFLGESRFESNRALRLLIELTYLSEDTKERHGKITNLLRERSKYSDWNALLGLMQRPWWSRAWIIQEFAVAQKVFFLCGSARLEGADFEKALGYLIDYKYNAMVPQRLLHLVRQVASTPISHLLTIRRQYQEADRKPSKNALDILYRSRSSKAFDARDKVYSVFRLISENTKLQPDYSRPVQELYMNVVEALIESSGTLEVLCHHNRGVSGIDNLPTWCPDWTVLHGKRLIMWKKKYSAAGKSRARAKIQGNILAIKGKILGVIRWLSDGLDARHFGDKHKLYATIMELRTRVLKEATSASKPYNDISRAFRETLVTSRILDKEGDGWKTRVLDTNVVAKMWTTWPLSLKASYHMSSEERKLVKDLNDALYASLCGRAFFVTEQGHLGLVDMSARVNDVVVVALGGEILFALHDVSRRPNLNKSISGSNLYELVGECYMHGYMAGEGLANEDPKRLSDLCLV